MSWFSKNYEKAALAGAVAVALGLAYLGWDKFGAVEQDFAAGLSGKGNNNTAVRSADSIPQTLASLKRDRVWTQALDGERPVDLFTGIPLFISSESPDKAIDLLKDPAVHAPIPNSWWVENRLDPGFADSPRRDPDQDGFSNLEEFNAKTDPNDLKSFPPLISKLMYVNDETLTWFLRPGYGDGGKFPISYRDSKNQTNKNDAANMVGPGDLFFAKPPMMNRFKLLGSDVRMELNKSTKTEKEVTIIRIEDQRPNKKGTVYEIPSPLSEERMNEHLKFDRTAVLSLEAIGLNGKEFKVEENTAFALPPDGGKKDFLAKSVTPDAVVVEYTTPAGEKKTVSINKGGLPQIID